MNGRALAAIERFAADWAEWMGEMAVQLAVLTAAVTALAWLFGNRSASFRYALWMVILVRLAIPPSLSLPTGWGWWLRGEAVADSAPIIPDGAAVTPEVALAPMSNRSRSEAAPQIASVAPADLAPPAKAASSATTSSLQTASESAAPGAGPSWSALLLLGWAGVSTTLLGLLLVGAIRTRQWVRKASRQLDPQLLRILGRARWRLEFTQDVELRNSENCTTPLVVGWWKPVILLPASVLRELDDDELEAVVLHELNHIRRRDALANFAQAVLGAIYFFHPLVWWANREIRRLREDACDEMTVAAMEGRRKAYGSALVKVSEILGYAAPPLALGVMESAHPAKRRLGRILDPNLPLRDRGSWLSVTLVTVLALVFLPAGPRPAMSLADDQPAVAEVAGNGEPAESSQAPRKIGNLAHNRGQSASGPKGRDVATDSDPPLLIYRWKPGQAIAYSINVEAEDADGMETRNGNVSYNVRSADRERATLAVFGITLGFRHSHPGYRPGLGYRPFDFHSPFETGGPRALAQERLLTLDMLGGVESMRGSIPLPFALGDLARLPIVPLPDRKTREWMVEGQVRIELEGRNDAVPRSAFFRPEAEVLEAQESNHYRLASWTAQQAVIERQVETATIQQVNGRPRMKITGGGEAVFDLDLGVVQSLRWNLTLTSNDEYISRETKIIVICKKLDPAAPGADAEASVKPIDFAQAIADFDSPELERVLIALRVVKETEPTTDRLTVAARLREFLSHSDTAIREAGAAAYGRWASNEDLDPLLELLAEESTSIRWSAMEALGRLQAEKAVKPIAARLTVGIDRVSAQRALTQIGPAAEPFVLPLLDHGDWGMRLTAVNILRDVGGAASLARLKPLAENDPQNNVRTWANLAAESIQKRLGE